MAYIVPWNSPGWNTGVGSLSFSRGSSQPRDQAQVSRIADSSPAEPQWKPENTGVGSLSLLQADLSDPRIETGSPALQVDSLPTELSGTVSWSMHMYV